MKKNGSENQRASSHDSLEPAATSRGRPDNNLGDEQALLAAAFGSVIDVLDHGPIDMPAHRAWEMWWMLTEEGRAGHGCPGELLMAFTIGFMVGRYVGQNQDSAAKPVTNNAA
jgi:hypothetical protein